MILKANFKPLGGTLDEVLHDLGDIPPERIRTDPPLGTATEEDKNRPENKLCELIDGILVKKAVGARESAIGVHIASLVFTFVEKADLGVMVGADGFFHLGGGQLRAPDISFTPWSSFPGEEIPEDTWWRVPPALWIEVLSPSNTQGEMDRKLREFFAAGSQVAWLIDPETRTARVYTSPKKFKLLNSRDVLEGGRVLPGFKLPLAEVFAATKRRKKR